MKTCTNKQLNENALASLHLDKTKKILHKNCVIQRVEHSAIEKNYAIVQ